MQAAVRSKYGMPGDLAVTEVPTPKPAAAEVLIKVYASSVNRTDCHVLTGKPFPMRLLTGLFKPKLSIIGTDFAGQVHAVGTEVDSFKVGDMVMGYGGGFGCGSHAEYFLLPQTKASRAMVKMPGNISYTQAAACLEGAFYAASVINKLKPATGQNALVYGATGAIGSSYVQFLKYYGVQVTAVCAGEHSELVTSLGAGRIIDYKTTDFRKDKEQFDYVFDAIGKSSFFQCKHLLKKNGGYAPSGGAENLFLLPIISLFGGKKIIFTAPGNIVANLNFIKDLLETGDFIPVIDRVYPLSKIAEAFIYVNSGQKIGNVIVEMEG